MGKRLPRSLLLNEIATEKAKLDDLLARLTDDEMLAPGVTPGGWSVKDILGHVVGWQRMILSFHEAEARGETPEVPGHGLTWRQTPELNAIIYREYRDVPLTGMLDAFKKGHRDLLGLAESVNDEVLVTVGKFRWMGPTWSLSDYIRAETASHYRWASGHIKRRFRTRKND